MAKPPHNMKGIAALLASQGRGGDTMLAHINPEEAALLKAHGGSGTINPQTGLPEFLKIKIGGWTAVDTGKLYDQTVGKIVGPNSITGDVVETVRKINGAAAGVVEDVAKKLGQTIEAIASDPKKLAAVAIMIAYPGAAQALGDFILGEALAVDAMVASGAMTAAEASLVGASTLSSGTVVSAIVGQTAINTALNGGDVEQAVKGALIQQGIPAAMDSTVMKTLDKDMQSVLGKYGAKAATQAGIAAIMGKDPVAAFVFSGATSAVGVITNEIPGYKELPSPARNAINAALTASLNGKDAATAAADSLVASAVKFGKSAVEKQQLFASYNRPALTASELEASKDLDVTETSRAKQLSLMYDKDFNDIAVSMAKEDDIPKSVRDANPDVVMKEIGNGLYTAAGGNDQFGPSWVWGKDGDVARFEGTMIFYDSADGSIKTAYGTTIDPTTGKPPEVVLPPEITETQVADSTQTLVDQINNAPGTPQDVLVSDTGTSSTDGEEDADFEGTQDQDTDSIINSLIGVGDKLPDEFVRNISDFAPTGPSELVGPPVPSDYEQMSEEDLVDLINSGSTSTTQNESDEQEQSRGEADATTENTEAPPTSTGTQFSGPAISRGSDGSYVRGRDWANRFFDDPDSPTGYSSVNGDPVNEDGTPYSKPAEGLASLDTGSTQQTNQESGLPSVTNQAGNESVLTNNGDGTYTRTFSDGTSVVEDENGRPVVNTNLDNEGEGTSQTETETKQPGWQGPNGPVTEDTARRQAEEFQKYLDWTMAGQPDAPDYEIQDLDISPENLQSFYDSMKLMDEEGRLPTQWKPNDDGTFTYTDDSGSTITIDESGEITDTTEAPPGSLLGENNSTTTTTTTNKPTTTTPRTDINTSTTSTKSSPPGLSTLGTGLLGLGALGAAASALDGDKLPAQFGAAPKRLKLNWNQAAIDAPKNGVAYGQQYLNPTFEEVDEEEVVAAQGGLMSLASGGPTSGSLGYYSDGGRLLRGPGDGMSDNIPATIAQRQPARLADGEFVIPADVVSHLGNGSTDAGSRVLYDMMNRVRKARTGNPKQGKQINPLKFIPK